MLPAEPLPAGTLATGSRVPLMGGKAQWERGAAIPETLGREPCCLPPRLGLGDV